MTIQDEIRSFLLPDCSIGCEILHFREIDSTNRLAKELAAQGAPSGTVLLADRQTAGRGRMGKSFHSPEGGLYLSVLLRPALPLSDLMAATACAAAAVHSALCECGVMTKIKWVNDLFLHDRKICGILCEGGFPPQGTQMDYLIVGIGLNLTPDANLPAELVPIVTDIATETGLHLSKSAVTAQILQKLDEYITHLPERSFLPEYTSHSYTLGKRVAVSRVLSGNVSRETIGTAVGFSQDAGLIVEFEDGVREVILSGTAVFADKQ